MPLRDLFVECSTGGFIGFPLDAHALVAAVGGLDRAGIFHLNSLCLAEPEALKSFDFRGVEQAPRRLPRWPGQGRPGTSSGPGRE